jgi:uncharacterized membrane protein
MFFGDLQPVPGMKQSVMRGLCNNGILFFCVNILYETKFKRHAMSATISWLLLKMVSITLQIIPPLIVKTGIIHFFGGGLSVT